MNPHIRFLHVSDIHYIIGPNPDNTRGIMIDGLKQFFLKHDKVECVLLTGDFLQQGNFYKDNNSVIDFIKEVCEVCFIRDRFLEWRKHVFFCPGNHDIYRDAYDKERKIKRVDELKKATDKLDELPGALKSSNDNYNLLVQESFWLFDKEVCSGITNKEEDTFGEYRLFQEDIVDQISSACYRFFFVGINTALFAGQVRTMDDVKRDLAKKRQELISLENDNYLNKDGYATAVKKYRDYLKCHRELMNSEACDEKRLSFVSNECVERIKKEIFAQSKEVIPFVVFFGHHPLEWFTTESQKAFALLAKRYSRRPFYLCGHEHVPKVNPVNVGYTDDHTTVIELEVGGGFPDESKWNQLSFSVDTLEYVSENKVKISGTIGYWCRLIKENTISYMNDSNQEAYWEWIDFGNEETTSQINTYEPQSSYNEVDYENYRIEETIVNNIMNQEDYSKNQEEKRRPSKISNNILDSFDIDLRRR